MIQSEKDSCDKTKLIHMNFKDQVCWNKQKFPAKLIQLLDVLDDPQGNSSRIMGISSFPGIDSEMIGGWNPDGRSFRINNTDYFVQSCMPFFFNQTKYKSFQRQLNIYGFTRITKGTLKGSYFHPDFFRGESPSKANMIQRRKQASERTSDEVLMGIRSLRRSSFIESSRFGNNAIVNRVRSLSDEAFDDDSVMMESMPLFLESLQLHHHSDCTVVRALDGYFVRDNAGTPKSFLACNSKNLMPKLVTPTRTRTTAGQKLGEYDKNSLPILVTPTKNTIVPILCNEDRAVTSIKISRRDYSQIEPLPFYSRQEHEIDLDASRISDDDGVGCDGIPIAELDCFDVDSLFSAPKLEY